MQDSLMPRSLRQMIVKAVRGLIFRIDRSRCAAFFSGEITTLHTSALPPSQSLHIRPIPGIEHSERGQRI